MLAILIPAAGASSRMRGTDKLMQDVGGIAALRHTVQAALEVSEDVFVGLPPTESHPRYSVIEDLPVTRVPVQRALDGMGASLATLADAPPAKVQAAMIVMPDMPDIGAPEMQLIARHRDGTNPAQIVQATTGNGLPGHPTLFGKSYIPALKQLRGDRGAFRLLQENAAHITAVPLPGSIARKDLDTPEDWAKWRSSQT